MSGRGQNVTRTDLGTAPVLNPSHPLSLPELFEWTFDLGSAIDLSANTRYWLGLHEGGDFVQEKGLSWMVKDGNAFGIETNYVAVGGDFDNWSTGRPAGNLPRPDAAFQLFSGTPTPGLEPIPDAAVPEPTILSLLALAWLAWWCVGAIPSWVINVLF